MIVTSVPLVLGRRLNHAGALVYIGCETSERLRTLVLFRSVPLVICAPIFRVDRVEKRLLTLRNSLDASWYSRVMVLGEGPAKARIVAKMAKLVKRPIAV